MRTAFIKALMEAAEKDPKIFLIVGDLGYSVVEPFAKKFPKQFLNCGVNEQTMTGMAAGIAMSGYRVFTYSIGNFSTLRCFEQIRNDVCYHGLDVCVVAIGGGYAYGNLGVTHHLTEDLGVFRTLPDIKVCAPADPVETQAAVKSICSERGPFYLRLGKAGEPIVHAAEPSFSLGKMIRVREGKNGLILTTGGMLKTALDAASQAEKQGKSVAVWSSPWVKPLDVEAVREAAKSFERIITLEEGQRQGGFGSSIAEVLAQMPSPRASLKIMGIPDFFLKIVKTQESARTHAGIDAASVVKVLLE